MTRRAFIKASATGVASFTLPRFSIGKPGPAANSKINVACIGVGNRGWYPISELMKDAQVNLVALCDVDEKLVEDTFAKAAEMRQTFGMDCADLATVPLFRDYREMFTRMGDRIDAVTICTPDHHHYPAAMLAIRGGMHVYVEKPLTHTVGEARTLLAAAQRHRVITQMGNQGRATEGIRLIKEWTTAGVLGDVRRVWAWRSPFSPRYFQRPESLPLEPEAPPPTLAWDLWLGPSEARPYHPLLVPEKWRGWWSFGNGLLGDWGCHTLDAPFWALELGAPGSIDVEVSGVDDEVAPEWAVVTYRFPARGKLPPVTLTWSEGAEKKPAAPDVWDSPEPLPSGGMMMFGSRNTLLTGLRPDSPRLLPDPVMEEFKRNRPVPTIPRVIGGPVKEWIDAIRGVGPLPCSNFEYSARLAEMVLLGAVAVRAGKRIEWDANAGTITNDPSLNRYVAIHARDGWEV